jgi:hypothetical protein
VLLIQPDQMVALEKAGLRRFEEEMVAHSREFSPRLTQALDKEQLGIAVGAAVRKARGYGFKCRGPIRLYMELTLLRGSGFDTDPQYPAFGEILRARVEEMERAERMYAAALDYRAKVSGPGAVSAYKALGGLLAFARAPVAVSGNAVDNMLFEMNRVHHRKVAYVGEAALTALIHEGIAECRKHRFTTFREAGLIMALMFTLGHRCTEDPLYPWIEMTLRDREIREPAAKAQRLEKSAEAWLEQMAGKRREPEFA